MSGRRSAEAAQKPQLRQRQMGELGKENAVRAAKAEGGATMLDAINEAASRIW